MRGFLFTNTRRRHKWTCKFCGFCRCYWVLNCVTVGMCVSQSISARQAVVVEMNIFSWCRYQSRTGRGFVARCSNLTPLCGGRIQIGFCSLITSLNILAANTRAAAVTSMIGPAVSTQVRNATVCAMLLSELTVELFRPPVSALACSDSKCWNHGSSRCLAELLERK